MKSTFIDLKNPDLYREGIPHEVFARLRREAPVAWNPEEDGRGFWAVTRYEDIVAVSKNPGYFPPRANMAAIGCSTRTWLALRASAQTKPKRR